MLLPKDFSLESYSDLIQWAQKFVSDIDVQKESFEARVSRTEIGQASLQHRGFYDPSPVDDIIIGNAKRGKLLKRLSPRSKDYIIFCFDDQDQLIMVKKFWNRKQCYTEYLQSQDDQIFGVCLDISGEITVIVHENYNRQRIARYRKALYNKNEGVTSIVEEHYFYDEQGLKTCEVHTIFRNPFEGRKWIDNQSDYEFQRENGYLTSYVCTTDKSEQVYQVHVERKA